jgi:hypothetical protein
MDFADSLGHHYFKPIVLISDINISTSGITSINTDRGSLQVEIDILPLNATNKKILWSSSQPLVASVNQSGLILAFNNGSTWIKASSTDDSLISDSILITTSNQSGILPVNLIVVNVFEGNDTISLNNGSKQLVAIVYPLNASNTIIQWEIDNPILADISQDGLLTAKKNGKVIVTAKSTDGSDINGSRQIVITGQFSEVSNIKILRQSYNADGTAYKITGEAILTHKVFHRNTKYIQDESAGMQIDDPFGKISSTYNLGDGITGITGYLEDNYGMLIFHPIEDPGAATSVNNPLTPAIVSVNEFHTNFDKYESQLIKINDLGFLQSGGIFLELMNYAVQAGNDITVIRTEFANADYLGTTIPETANITGIAIRLNTTPKLAPRNLSDIEIPSTNVGINGSSKVNLWIYPNPIAEEIHFASKGKYLKFEIRDISGRLIMK